jgi:hypothetical protein
VKKRKYIKLVCMMLFVSMLMFLFLTGHQRSNTTQAFSFSLNNGYTGANNEVTCATSGCHTGVAQADKDDFTVTVSPPDSGIYTIVVTSTSSDSSRKRWGFQMTALTNENAPAGTFADSLDGTTEIILNKGPNSDRQYIQNSAAGTFRKEPEAKWTFRWTAPPGNRDVIFYAAGVQANNDRTSSGDLTFTRQLTINTSGITIKPEITGAAVMGKKLFIRGENFSAGALIYVDEVKQKTRNDEETPQTMLIAPKAGKNILSGQMIKVKNSNNVESEPFEYVPPSNN